MSAILLTQTATVVYRVEYSREDIISMLVISGSSRDSLESMSNDELGTALVGAASDEDNAGLYDKLVENAGEWQDIIDTDDWEVTEVYS